MTPSAERQLARLKDRYQQRANELAEVGFMLRGSLTERFLPCGTPGCRCHTDSAHLHGPYWQWSQRHEGKTQSRFLRGEQLRRHQEWLNNGRRFDKIVSEMIEISTQADAILVQEERKSNAEAPTARKKQTPRRRPLKRA